MENFDNTIRITKEKEKLIKNLELSEYVKFKLDKEEIKKEDLDKIEEIIIDSKNIVGGYNKVYFEEVELFKNLKRITIKNLGITRKDIQKIKNIQEIEFRNCEITGIEQLEKVEHLTIINSKIEQLEKISNLINLTELELINIEATEFDFLEELKNLKTLKIKNIKKFGLEEIRYDLPIEYLSIEDIGELELKTISKYKNLKTLSVDREEAKRWKNELEILKEEGIEILLNDIYKY